MKPKMFSKMATFAIVKDEVGGVCSTIEEKSFKSNLEALEYCKKRMEEIKEQERKEARKIEYDALSHAGVTYVPRLEKDSLYDYFATMGGCCRRFYTFSIRKEVYLGILGWIPRKYARIPKDPKKKNAIAKVLEEKE